MSEYDSAFKRMTTRINQDPEISLWEKVLAVIIVFMANMTWVTFALGYLIGHGWQAGGLFWLGTAWVVAVQVFWGYVLGKRLIEHFNLLEKNSGPQDTLRRR